MASILGHPFLKHDTPGIYYTPPPSVSKLQLSLQSEKDIDPDIFISIRIIYGKHATGDGLRKALLSDKPTRAKAFYTLLSKFRERRKEVFDESDPFGPPTDLRPYQPSRARIFAFHTLSSPAIPPNLRQCHTRHHTRTKSSPSCQSPTVLVQSRLPVAVNRYTKLSETDAANEVSTEPKGNSSQVTLVSNKVSDLLVPLAPDPPAPSAVPNSNVDAPRNPPSKNTKRIRKDTSFRPKPHRRDTAPDPSRSDNVAKISAVYTSSNATRKRSNRETPQIRPSSAFEASIPESFVPIKVPRLYHPEAQLEMEELIKRMNALCLRDVEYMQKEGKGFSMEVSEGKHSSLSRSEQQGKVTMAEKENIPVKSRVNEFGRRVPNMFRRGSTAESSVVNEDSKRSRNDRSLMKRLKRECTRPNLRILKEPWPCVVSDLENSWISAVSTSDAPSVHSESSPTSSTLRLTPMFKGWLSHLFHLKHPVYRIHSVLNCLASKDETKRLLSKLGIHVSDDIINWNVLKCKVDFELGS